MPVLVKHPVQANLAAPFFTVVELFKMAGLRDELFFKVFTGQAKGDVHQRSAVCCGSGTVKAAAVHIAI